MCSTALTETIEYYVIKKNRVYILLIDASKAFDRIKKLYDNIYIYIYIYEFV